MTPFGAAPAPVALRLAGTLCWLWGGIFLSSAIALGFPAVSREGFGRNLEVPVVILAMAVGFFFAGYGLPRRNRDAAQAAIGLSLLGIVAPVAFRLPIFYVGAVISILILLLTAANYRQFVR